MFTRDNSRVHQPIQLCEHLAVSTSRIVCIDALVRYGVCTYISMVRQCLVWCKQCECCALQCYTIDAPLSHKHIPRITNCLFWLWLCRCKSFVLTAICVCRGLIVQEILYLLCVQQILAAGTSLLPDLSLITPDVLTAPPSTIQAKHLTGGDCPLLSPPIADAILGYVGSTLGQDPQSLPPDAPLRIDRVQVR